MSLDVHVVVSRVSLSNSIFFCIILIHNKILSLKIILFLQYSVLYMEDK